MRQVMRHTHLMTTIGYMRVSTAKQETLLQRDALLAAGVLPANSYQDTISGKTVSRAGLDACLARLVKGDTLLVWRLDRFGRSMQHLLTMVEDLKKRGVLFRSLSDPHLDTTSANGELIFHIFAALAQFERRLIAERVKAGIKAKMDEGRPRWGKEPAVNYCITDILRLYADGESARSIATGIGISKDTVLRVLKKEKVIQSLPGSSLI